MSEFVLAIDPGKNAGFAIARINPFLITGVSTSMPMLGVRHTVVVERPVLRTGKSAGGKKINPKSVVSLAICAGFLAGMANANPNCDEIVWLEPTKWKGLLYKSAAYAPKEVYVNRLRRDLAESYVGDMNTLTDDQVDACGIARAYAIYLDER